MAGDNIPRGKASVGWRVGVYWKDDQKFYYGEVVSFDPSSGRSTVVYTDGADPAAPHAPAPVTVQACCMR